MLAGMQPELDDRSFIFVCASETPEGLPANAFALIQEEEGKTLVLPAQSKGEEGEFARITLQVHSDLEGIGLTAAVSTALAKAGIACNVIAAFHHDHLFVPWKRRKEALHVLQKLSREARD
ncbi:ACT domain-containing protein [Erythrobacter sp. SCSIO 43205]|nr:ACT domain-containing protein [Erythrobacter sp. SCSIO 43205]